MKRIRAIALLLTLLLALCGAARAEVGDVTVCKTKAFHDALCNHYAGEIPKNTSVMVEEYGPFFSRIRVKSAVVYVATHTLKHNGSRADHVMTLQKGLEVYQQPTFFSNSVKMERDTRVYVCAAKNGWVMVRGGRRGIYAYVPLMDIQGNGLLN